VSWSYGSTMLTSLEIDLHFAVRMLRKSPLRAD
jgi:hypothetical protein